MLDWNANLISRFDQTGPRYTSYPPANFFNEEVSPGDLWAAIDSGNQQQRPLSLYLHFPFCRHVCFYCACHRVITADKRKVRQYVDDIKLEIQRLSLAVGPDRPVVQMHWGGGTPTYLDDTDIADVMTHLAQHFNIRADDQHDYAIEIDPRTVTAERLAFLRRIGFNRVSFGVQDLDETVQQAINRVQPTAMIESVMSAARAQRFQTVSVDLIYGLPRQTSATLSHTLDTMLAMSPDRIALYNYAHLPERFKVQRQIDAATLPDAREKLAMLTLAGKTLEQAGYRYIGMDHFARQDDSLAKAQDAGLLQRNFQGYSSHGDADILGLGVSAISQVGRLYAQNHKSIASWSAHVRAGDSAMERGYCLTADDALRREVIMNLLCHLQLDLVAFKQRWGVDFADYFGDCLATLAQWQQQGLLTLDDQVLRVHLKGRLVVRALVMIFDSFSRSSQHASRYSRIL